MIAFIVLVVISSVLISSYATRLLLKTTSLGRQQKSMLIAGVWLLPFLFAGIVIAFIKSDDDSGGPDKPSFGGGGGDSVEGVGLGASD